MENRRKRNWMLWILIVTSLPVLYALSSGPARYLLVTMHTSTGYSPTSSLIGTITLPEAHPAWTYIYGPLEMLSKTGSGRFLRQYWNLFPMRKT